MLKSIVKNKSLAATWWDDNIFLRTRLGWSKKIFSARCRSSSTRLVDLRMQSLTVWIEEIKCGTKIIELNQCSNFNMDQICAIPTWGKWVLHWAPGAFNLQHPEEEEPGPVCSRLSFNTDRGKLNSGSKRKAWAWYVSSSSSSSGLIAWPINSFGSLKVQETSSNHDPTGSISSSLIHLPRYSLAPR